MSKSRNEKILENMLGGSNELSAPISRTEKILQNMLGAEYELLPPMSKTEDLLQQILEKGGSGVPSQTKHTIYFEFEDGTNTTITAFWNDSFISDAIRATEPTTYDSKIVTLAQLDGVTWHEVADIPLNTQLIDFSKVKSGYIVDDKTGGDSVSEWGAVSDYTLINPSMTFNYIGYQWYNLGFYDSNKDFISSIYMHDDADSIENDYANGTLTPSKIPSNAMYIRISTTVNADDTMLSLIRTT